MKIETLHAGCGSFPKHVQDSMTPLSSVVSSHGEVHRSLQDVAVPAGIQREGEESDLGVAWVRVLPLVMRAST